MDGLPRAVSIDQEFYADHSRQLGRVADLLAEQNDLIRQMLAARQDGQPEPAADERPGPHPVELREPDPPASAAAPADEPKPKTTRRRATAAKKGT
ncbi:hypothetical protein Drose_06225 [Dactylosporangium roseum]|uniref:Uncharacterized protein n=1 Tax=Dactylosporangium roseum TaxID=47989 RepID=A0ABY5Z737_9ACTN|nr:hypothetical protein [Dactylosporangium roseum]UWZ37868.1 hypothetical protein Drose_06225 [Dactylosporangium roseum]